MGYFSWKDCKNKRIAIKIGRKKSAYVLVPKEFVPIYGEQIIEECYEGYGEFGKYDIYDLIVIWNRKWISENPEFEVSNGEKLRDFIWYEAISNLSLTIDNAVDEVKKIDSYFKLRYAGIDIACYDEDNACLKYPIKITYTKCKYEDCRKPSLNDPNQGF